MSTKLAKIIADFRTSLSTEIAVSGTSATLQSATDDDGVSLPAGKYFFTLDGNNSVKEHILCDLSGTSLTNIKSVSRQGAQTTGVSRKHRVGATVVITDFAHIRYINDLLDGTTNLNASTPLQYDGTATINNDNQLATKAYVDGVAVAGAPDASVTVKGLVEIATGAELAAGTATGGTGAILVAGGASFKNSSAGAGDATKIPVLNASGVLDQTFLGGARTWAGVQSFTADNCQITSDADSANDAVRKSFMDSSIDVDVTAFATPGTSGEAWTGAGVPLYVKASDGKLYQCDADADESTYSFVGFSTATVGGADVATTYVRPGGILAGLSSLTPGAFYFLSGTAGTIAASPGARSAKVAQALTATTIRVLQPSFYRQGTFTISGTGNTTVTTGFLPTSVEIMAFVSQSTGTDGIPVHSLGDESNTCFVAGYDGTNQEAGYDNANAFRVRASGGSTDGTISAYTQTGFTVNCANFSSTARLMWRARS